MAKIKASKSSSSSSSSSLSSQVDVASTRLAKKKSLVSAHATARLGLLSGLIEGTLVMMELMAGLAMVKAAFSLCYRTLNGLRSEMEPPPLNAFCIHVAANIVMIGWLTFRLSQKHLPVISIREMGEKLQLWPLPTLTSDTLSMVGTIFGLHFVGTAGMYLFQFVTGDYIFSFQNYYKKIGDDLVPDYINGADMLLLAPIREELTFRGLVFTIFYLRGVAFRVASSTTTSKKSIKNTDEKEDANGAVTAPTEESLGWTSAWKADCVIASAVAFGLVHLLNVFGSKYTKTYIILQVFLGMILGSFYCFRFVMSDNSILEPIMLHMINNFFSSFLPVEEELDLSNPLVIFPLLLTFVVYGTLSYKQWQKLKDQPPQPFTVLQSPINPTPQQTNEPTAIESTAESKEE